MQSYGLLLYVCTYLWGSNRYRFQIYHVQIFSDRTIEELKPICKILETNFHRFIISVEYRRVHKINHTLLQLYKYDTKLLKNNNDKNL